MPIRPLKDPWFKPNSMRFRQLRELPRFNEIVQRLKDGQSPDYVTKVIQDEMRECLELTPLQLSNMLRKFRAELGVVAVTDGENGRVADGLDKALTEKIDLYEQYAFLVNAQKWRIKRALAREAGSPGMMASLYRDLDVLRQTLKDFADFQLETGMIRRQPVMLDATVRSQNTNTQVNMAVLLTADAATREEARNATDALVKLLSQQPTDPTDPISNPTEPSNTDLDEQS